MPLLRVPVALKLDAKAAAVSDLAQAVDAIWTGRLRIPPGIVVEAKDAKAITLRIEGSAFALEPDAFAVLELRHLRLTEPLLIPCTHVRSLRLIRTAVSLEAWALCSSTKTVTLKEAKRLSRKPSLPPGIHNSAALLVVDGVKPHTVQGGLPSLGKRR